MMTLLTLAQVSGEGIVKQLIFVLIIGVCLLIVWWLGKFAAGQFGAPPIALKIWNGLFVLLLCLCAINFLLSLIGGGWHPRW